MYILLPIKTVSPKRVVTIDNSYAHFLTISGHFFANHIIIFHKTEVQWSIEVFYFKDINVVGGKMTRNGQKMRRTINYSCYSFRWNGLHIKKHLWEVGNILLNVWKICLFSYLQNTGHNNLQHEITKVKVSKSWKQILKFSFEP